MRIERIRHKIKAIFITVLLIGNLSLFFLALPVYGETVTIRDAKQEDTYTDSGLEENFAYPVNEDYRLSYTDISGSMLVNYVGGNVSNFELDYQRAAIKFDLSGINGKISSAQMTINIVDAENSPVVNLISTTDNLWTQTNEKFPEFDAGNIINGYSGVLVTSNESKNFDVKAYLQSIIDSEEAAANFVLTGMEGGDKFFNFVSNLETTNAALRPKLEITYTPAPVVTSVTVPVGGDYKTGQNLDFTVHFDKAVTVTGIPRIPINIGGKMAYATYLNGGGNTDIVFRYTVATGDEDTDGIAVGTAFENNGGSIQDAVGGNAVRTLNSVGDVSAVKIACVVNVVSGGNGIVTGGGDYGQGRSATLGAAPEAGYNFDGWYIGEIKVSSLPNYTFTVTEDTSLTAKFVVMQKGDIEIIIEGNGSVKLNSATNISANYTAQYSRGASILLTAEANSGYTFAYWQDNLAGRIISTDSDYAFTMGTGVSVKAVFFRIPDSGTFTFTILFKDKSGKILQSSEIAKGAAASPPADPALAGYSFTGWDQTFSNITSDMIIRPIYERLSTVYDVTAINGTLSTGGTGGSFQYDMPVTVIAGDAPVGQKFAYWTQDGIKISFGSTYSFFMPMKATILEAIFVDDETTIEEIPFVTLSTDVQVDTVVKTMLFTAHRTVPAGYTLVESGILLLEADTAPTELAVNTANVIRGKVKDSSTDQFYIRKTNITTGKTWYARAYLIYKDAAGNIVTVYSCNTVNRTM